MYFIGRNELRIIVFKAVMAGFGTQSTINTALEHKLDLPGQIFFQSPLYIRLLLFGRRFGLMTILVLFHGFFLLFGVTFAASSGSARGLVLFFRLPVAGSAAPVIGPLQGRCLIFLFPAMAFPAAQFLTLHIYQLSALLILCVMAGATTLIP